MYRTVSCLVDYTLVCYVQDSVISCGLHFGLLFTGQCHFLWITLWSVMYRTVSFLVDYTLVCNVQDSVISYGLQFDLYDLQCTGYRIVKGDGDAGLSVYLIHSIPLVLSAVQVQ